MLRGPFKARPVSEDTLHLAVAARLVAVCIKAIFWHTPNGEDRDPAIAQKLKRMGVRSGAPDFFILHERTIIALELKTHNVGSKLSKAQEGFRDAWQASGFSYSIVRDLNELEVFLRIYNIC